MSSIQLSCMSSEFQPTPTQLPIRLYQLAMRIPTNEALNCGQTSDYAIGRDIGEQLKATMNRWKADGFDTETGHVDYQRLANSAVFEEYHQLVIALRDFDPSILTTADEQKAFWINIYNVLMIHGVIAYGVEKSVLEIKGVFERVAYIVGGLRYSLDDIENGILRGNRAHIAMPGVRFGEHDPRRQFVITPFDPRIHFTLVCGSSSCPPIGIYQADKLESQLDIAATNFINDGGVLLNKAKMTVSLSRIFQWFSSDFGGRWMGFGSNATVLRYIAHYILDPIDAEFIADHAEDLNVSYQQYDWSLNV